MANKDASSSFSFSNYSSEIKNRSSEMLVHVCGMPFVIDKVLVAKRSAKLDALLNKESEEHVADYLRDVTVSSEILGEVLKFCRGFHLALSAENVMPVIIVAYSLEMTETHSKNNLLQKALTFFKQKLLPSWNETIKALHTLGNSFDQAVNLGLVEACIDSLVSKAMADPRLLGEPMCKPSIDSEDEEEYRPNARKRLFDQDWKSMDLSLMPIQLYEPIIQSMNKNEVPAEYVAAAICEYAKKWVFPYEAGAENLSIYKKKSHQEVIEAVQRLLPQEVRIVPCKFLFEMLRFSIFLDCRDECRNGFESRIGKQLDQATVQDLLIPSKGYAKELQYDTECVGRILKHYYGNYNDPDSSGLIKVADLIERFLVYIASDIDLKPETLASVAEMSMAATVETPKNVDGVYKAIDIYLDKHKYLTRTEKEDICKVLDCRKMSPEALEHAAKNERLPLRFVVQVLFMAQMQLRDAVTKEVQVFDDRMNIAGGYYDDEESEEKVGLLDEHKLLTEMEKMNIKVVELEKECYTMRKKIENERNSNYKPKKKTVNMWNQLKRKLGCAGGMYDTNCQVKKKKLHRKH